jgi:hypothetical protein
VNWGPSVSRKSNKISSLSADFGTWFLPRLALY